jgi:hypothetical protein
MEDGEWRMEKEDGYLILVAGYSILDAGDWMLAGG